MNISSISSYLKKILKMAIVFSFFLDKYWDYASLKAKETDTSHTHHQIIPGFEMDYGRIKEKYDSHQLFKVPFTKTIVESAKNFIIHNTKINTTYAHSHDDIVGKIIHNHPDDAVHSSSNKLTDIDTKLSFGFLIIYDLITLTILYSFVNVDSYSTNPLLLTDSFLKIISIAYKDFKNHSFKILYSHFYMLIQDLLNKDFSGIFHDLKVLIFKEKELGLNMFIFSVLFLHQLITIAQWVRNRWGGQDLKAVAEAAYNVRKALENNLKDRGLISEEIKDAATDLSKEEIQKNADVQMGKHEVIGNRPFHRKIENVNGNEKGTRQRSRENTPSKRRMTKPTQ